MYFQPDLMIRLGQLGEYFAKDAGNEKKIEKLNTIPPRCTMKCERKKKLHTKIGPGWNKEMGNACMVDCYVKKITKQEKDNKLVAEKVYHPL
uniref:Uncharacterized protein n=1 Tax=Trichuris muris TaxID=70415 RepID=A0A5S6QRE0_TRIMR